MLVSSLSMPCHLSRWHFFPRHLFEKRCPSPRRIKLTSARPASAIKILLTLASFVLSVCRVCPFILISFLATFTWETVFCQPVPVCSTCRQVMFLYFPTKDLTSLNCYRTKFPMKTLQRLNALRPILPSSNLNSSRSAPSTPQVRTATETEQIASPANGIRNSTLLGAGGLPHSGSIGNGIPRTAQSNGNAHRTEPQ